MQYRKIEKGIFISRPNRFIAHVELEGRLEICHVKNTGRLKELFVPGAVVYLEDSMNISRKTRYDLVAVEKGSMLVNVDSQAPNPAVKEWLRSGGLYEKPVKIIPEYRYGDSKIDFYIEDEKRRALIEVKGVTLERNGVAAFPDAPTERGVRHIKELAGALKEGYEAYVIFVIQFKPVKYFIPNDDTHPAFGQALREASDAGVKVLAYDCRVEPDGMMLDSRVEIRL